mgnify:CR=1 FL=1
MAAYEIDCPDCGGEGHHMQWVGPGYESGYGYVPFERITMCERCEGTGSIEPNWIQPEDELPEVGETVLVLGIPNGKDKLTMLNDVLLEDGHGDVPSVIWRDCAHVEGWAQVPS